MIKVTGNLTHEMKVTNSTEYGEFYGLIMYDTDGEPVLPGYELVERIIACQIAYYLLRRTGYVCGSNCDAMWQVIKDLKKQYLELTGTEYQDPNVDTDW